MGSGVGDVASAGLLVSEHHLMPHPDLLPGSLRPLADLRSDLKAGGLSAAATGLSSGESTTAIGGESGLLGKRVHAAAASLIHHPSSTPDLVGTAALTARNCSYEPVPVLPHSPPPLHVPPSHVLMCGSFRNPSVLSRGTFAGL